MPITLRLEGNLTFYRESYISLCMTTPSGRQGHLRYPLSRLFASVGSLRVLRVLADGLARSAPQIAAAAGLTPQGARRVLDGLAGLSIVTVKGSARTQLFELAGDHPFRQPLLQLFEAERSLWELRLAQLRECFKRQADVRSAWLYGSVARGEDTPSSDIDVALLVSSSTTGDEVRESLMQLEDELQLHVSLTALTSADLAALSENDPWWTGVVRDARVLKGGRPESEMKKVRAQRAAA